MTVENTRTVAVQYKDKDGAWRVKLRNLGLAFPDDQKQIFLENIAKHGRKSTAAVAAGVSTNRVNRELEMDEEFKEAFLEASQAYVDRVVGHHQDLLFEGQTKVSYDRQGNVVSEEKVYPVRLIELELKKHDEGYRDKREVGVKVSGGVLVAPADVASIDDWEEKFSGTTIEGEVIDGQD